jgi:hypothetical protein
LDSGQRHLVELQDGKYFDLRILHGFLGFVNNGEVESARESNQSQDSQRVIVECLEWRKWGSQDALSHVFQAPLSEIFHLFGMDVVE